MIKHFQLNNSEKSRNFAKTNDVQAKPNNESFSLDNSSLNFPGPKRPWQ